MLSLRSRFILWVPLLAACEGVIRSPGAATGEAPIEPSTTHIDVPYVPGGAGGSGGTSGVGGAGGSGGIAGHGGAGGGGTVAEVIPPFSAGALRQRRLRAWQYKNAIEDLLGSKAMAAVAPPADVSIDGLEVLGAAQLVLSTSQAEAYETSAFAAVAAGLADTASAPKVLTCTPKAATDTVCFRTIISTWGRRAFRRTLDPTEVDVWAQIAVAAATAYAAPLKGVELALAGMLQSPHFLYQVETGVADGTYPSTQKLSGTELATRLSFFITGHLPTAALLTTAEAGGLDTAAGLELEASKLLATQSPAGLRSLFSEWFSTREVATQAKDPKVFPSYTAAIVASLQKEAEMLIDATVLADGADVRTVLTSNFTFVNSTLQTHYGWPVTATATTFVKVPFPANERRAGFMTQGAFLASKANTAAPSSTRRGKFVRDMLLCETIPAPPPNVNDTMLPQPTSSATARDRVAPRLASGYCGACHKRMEPFGLSLENFDAVGKFRAQEGGAIIDASGKFDDGSTFADGAELSAKVAKDPRFAQCFARMVMREALGHVDGEGETVSVRDVAQGLSASGFQLKGALLALVKSEAFRYGNLEGSAHP